MPDPQVSITSSGTMTKTQRLTDVNVGSDDGDFSRFEDLTVKLLQVPKDELDSKLGKPQTA